MWCTVTTWYETDDFADGRETVSFFGSSHEFVNWFVEQFEGPDSPVDPAELKLWLSSARPGDGTRYRLAPIPRDDGSRKFGILIRHSLG